MYMYGYRAMTWTNMLQKPDVQSKASWEAILVEIWPFVCCQTRKLHEILNLFISN